MARIKKPFNYTRLAFIIIALTFCLTVLWTAVSSGKQNPAPTPSNSGEMSEECKKIWLEQGEAVAEQNGC